MVRKNNRTIWSLVPPVATLGVCPEQQDTVEQRMYPQCTSTSSTIQAGITA